MSSLLYFAYGSNADPERFRARVGTWLSREAACLRGYRLRFASSVRSEGGGGAVIDREPDGVVVGVVFGITSEQLDAMDRVEFDPERDPDRRGKRRGVQVETANGVEEAEVYLVEDDGGTAPPSTRYLGHILRGLADVGHSSDALDEVREIARRTARSANKDTGSTRE